MPFPMQGMGAMGGAGLGNMGVMGGVTNMMNNPEMMAQMMQSPIMQSMLNDPEMLRNMVQSTPGMSEVTAMRTPLHIGFISACCMMPCLIWACLCAPAARPGKFGCRSHSDVHAFRVMDRNPEFRQMLSNPEVLRESMRLAANPVRRPYEPCHVNAPRQGLPTACTDAHPASPSPLPCKHDWPSSCAGAHA